jgi:hypothetical protein
MVLALSDNAKGHEHNDGEACGHIQVTEQTKPRGKETTPLLLESWQAKVPPPEWEGRQVSRGSDNGTITFGE